MNARFRHKAEECDALKEFQRRHLYDNGVDPKSAPHLRGYPAPGQLPCPRPQSATPLSSTQNSANTQPRTSLKRSLCALCDDLSHETNRCPLLGEAAVALKKKKSETALLAIKETESDSEVENGTVTPL